MDIKRQIYHQIVEKLEPGMVVVLYGPRRVGKTYLLNQLNSDLTNQKENVVFLKGDVRLTQDVLSSLDPQKIINYIGRQTSVLIIDEAQKIPQIGDNLKLIVDEFPNLKIIASGSASFELSQKLGEPLTGRQKTLLLYPVSATELINSQSITSFTQSLENLLVSGTYPKLFSLTSQSEKIEYLLNLTNDYLFRDILELDKVKGSKVLFDLLTLLAFQIGKEVSLTELATRLDLHRQTISRYLDLLEKSFIIFNIHGFSRNLRKEIYQNSRWYFYDNGVRNAIINNFNPLNQRDDVGALWENYLIVERLKKQAYSPIYSHNYFWRTYEQQEIDWVEEREGKLFGFEIKWQTPKKTNPPSSWLKTYSQASYQIITRDNFLNFIT